MVDTYGRWTEEKDYSNYPKEKLCDYDRMAIWIRSKGYEPKTSMENLIGIIFAHFDGGIVDDESDFCPNDYYDDYTDRCKEYVEMSGGISEFDYEP